MTYELYHYGVKGMKWGVRRAEKKRIRSEKSQFREDTKEYKRLRQALATEINTSAANGNRRQDRNRNTQRLVDLANFVDNKRTTMGKDYVDRMIKTANRQDKAVNISLLVGSVAVASAAMVGLAYLEDKI